MPNAECKGWTKLLGNICGKMQETAADASALRHRTGFSPGLEEQSLRVDKSDEKSPPGRCRMLSLHPELNFLYDV